jgi:hypothetical protein
LCAVAYFVVGIVVVGVVRAAGRNTFDDLYEFLCGIAFSTFGTLFWPVLLLMLAAELGSYKVSTVIEKRFHK